MRDAVELEWAGIPSVPIIHEAVTGSAASMAKLSGVPAYPFVIANYPYIPTAIWRAEELDHFSSRAARRDLGRCLARQALVDRGPRGEAGREHDEEQRNARQSAPDRALHALIGVELLVGHAQPPEPAPRLAAS